MWHWDRLLLGGTPLAAFDIGEGVECQQGLGQDLWPGGWQAVGIGEEWDWAGIWSWSAEVRRWLPPKYWVVWWRLLRRNVMLNFRSGHLVEGGQFDCEECFGVG